MIGNRKWKLTLSASVGERKRPSRCALATDIFLKYPELQRPYIDQVAIGFSDPENGIRLYWTPSTSVIRWIKQYDSGENPKDLDITLSESEATVRPIEKAARSPRSRASVAKRANRAGGRTVRVRT